MRRLRKRVRFWLWPVGFVFLPVFGVVAVVDLTTDGRGGPHHGFWFGPLVMLLLFFLALALVAWFAHWLTRPAGGEAAGEGIIPADTERDPAIQALRGRFALGEIDEAEYRRRLVVLTETAPGVLDGTED